jgi:uncharacterized protein (DUF849 family)
MTSVLILLTFPEDVRNYYRTMVSSAFPELTVDVVDHHSKVGPFVGSADILITFGPMMSDHVLKDAPRLKWIQAMGTGTDGILDSPSLRPDIVVTNIRGIHGAAMSEATLLAMLALSRDLPRSVRAQDRHAWERWPSRVLNGRIVGIFGIGAITCAVTGSIHTPTMSDALPITPDQIAEQAIGAAEAGAAILHLHARDPNDGRPTPDPKVFMQFLPRIKQSCDAVINITTGGSVKMTVEERLAAPLEASPEMCSLNMGSMNFALYPMAARYKQWKHAWEKDYLVGSDDNIFRNTFRDIEKIYKLLGEGHGTKFEHECYDVGHLYNLAHCIDRGLFKPPVFLQLIFGILGGIGPDMENLMFMKRTADKLFGEQYRWSVLAAGRHQIPFGTQAVMIGGNVRVGLEDSLFIGRGKLAKNNAEQVAKIRRIIDELGYEAATPAEAREMLGLKGADRVSF